MPTDAKKLKMYPETVQQEGKSDPDKVILLNIKVITIVAKLESMNMKL